MGEILAILMFVASLLAILIGFPVAFTLAGIALVFSGIGTLYGVFDPFILSALGSRYFGIMTNEVLTAVPLFIFMGVMLERSKLAEDLLKTMGQLFGELNGGLGISVILVGTLLAASTGIVGATVVTMGLLSLPILKNAGYDDKLSAGTICASGSLGQLIPPSTVLIFMGDILQGANQTAQLEMGNLSPTPISVGQLFAGALLPGLILVLLYMFWTAAKAIFNPSSCPGVKLSDEEKKDLPRKVIVALLPPLFLIFAVLGSILAGIATPTESASVGAVGTIVLASLKKMLNLSILKATMKSTLMISSMVFIILLGASVFSLVFRGLGGEDIVYRALSSAPGGVTGAVLIVMIAIFFLGFFLDTFEIIFITVPIGAPILIRLGVDPIWLGVMIGMNLQTSFLTPPFGFALFYLKGVAGRSISTINIYLGAMPFVGLQVIGMTLLFLIPDLATWLPKKLFEPKTNTLFEETHRDHEIVNKQHNIDNFNNLFIAPNIENVQIDQFEDLLKKEPEY
ncbi:MAG: C4-dicarboxylate ABC transporter [Rhodospirillaceae bacterium]|nr:C4-dicarboxylate ABC transporter [Rhodospirillaceae bacterium]